MDEEIYMQHHIIRPVEGTNDVAHRTGQMTKEMVAEWLALGYTILHVYSGTKLRKNKDGHLTIYG